MVVGGDQFDRRHLPEPLALLLTKSQTAINSALTGNLSKTNQRPSALATSRPIKPPPMMPILARVLMSLAC